MASSADTFRLLIPAYSGLSDTDINTWLGFATVEMSVSVWGDYYTQGACYLAAHKMSLAGVDTSGGATSGVAGGGPVSSVTTARMSMSYAVASGPSGGTTYESTLMQTRYGQEYFRLLTLVGAVVSHGCV